MARHERLDWAHGSDAAASVVPMRSRRRRTAALALAIATAWSLVLSVAGPSAAAPGTRVNIEPETLEVQVGQNVTLTAILRDAGGNPATGSNSSTHVRWYFGAGSPNDPSIGNSSHDFECFTGETGSCSITYVASSLGVDTICALAGGSPANCAEPLNDAEWEDNADVVLRSVVTDPTPTPTPDPTPTPTPDPTPTPTPDPTPSPTPDPTPDPTPSPTPDPTPTPTPDPTPSPSPDPTPTPDPTPDPTPSPTPTPTPDPTPTPTPEPTPSPTPDPTPTPTPDPTPSPAANPMPTPTPDPTPEAAPAPRVAPTESPSPIEAPAAQVAPTPAASAAPAPEEAIHPREEQPAPAPRPAPAAAPTTAPPPSSEPTTAPAQPSAPVGPADVVGEVVTAAVDQVARVVRPEAVVAVATHFTFPLALAVAVLGYLLVQGHVDRRDPKLRMAPQHIVETLVAFRAEEEL